MRIRQQWRWLIAALAVVVPLATVLVSLSYGGMIWLLVALACGSAASVALVELGARTDGVGRRSDPGEEQLIGLRALELRPPGDK